MNYRAIFFFMAVFILISCNSINKLYVNYGAEQAAHSNNETVTRVYFDRKGFIYPSAMIDDAQLRQNDSRLELLYKNNNELYERICSKYNAASYAGNWDSVEAYKDPLQTALVNNYIDMINRGAQGKIPVFIIHGFNEHPSKPDSVKSCFAENRITAEKLRTLMPGKNFHFVEVYWDGMAAQNGAGVLKPFNSIKIWNNAQASATYAGLELRRILAKVNSPDIYVITHSHGAGVITTALFNTVKFTPSLYDNPDSWLYDIKNNRFNNPVYNSPVQRIHIGMLAPAIPGVNVFEEYYQRTVNGKNTQTDDKNYHFVIGFNANDPVTSKGKLFVSKVGSTTLASKRTELAATQRLFANNPTIMDSVNFSRYISGRRQVKHGWLVYMSSEPWFSRFVNKTFGQ